MSENNSALDSLLDSKLDDLADLPEFKVFPPGAHRVIISFSTKEINKHPAVEMKMKLVETVELAEPTDVPVAAGTETSVAFMLDNEFGQGALKEVCNPLAKHFGTDDLRSTFEAALGAEVTVVTKLRADKNDADKKYLQVKSLIIS